MGWGTPIKTLWGKATDTAKAAATKAAQTASSAYDYTKTKAVQAYQYSKEKAVQAYNFAEKKAVQGYQFAKDKAIDGYNAGKDVAKAAADKAVAAGRFAQGVATADAGFVSHKAKDAYNKARAAFGLKPAGSPVKDCAHPITDKKFSDLDRDGWIMVPQGKDKPCLAVPPGKSSTESNSALKSARKQASTSSSDCCNKRRAAGMGQRDIVFMNGIQNDSNDHCQTLNAIASQTCGRVVGVYNATGGKGFLGFAADIGQSIQDRRLVEQAAKGKRVPTQNGRNPAVDTLAKVIATQVQDGDSPELWLHSQGAAGGSLALADAKIALHPVMGRRALAGVKVKSFGSAAPIWVDGLRSPQHFVHINDPVATWFGVGKNPAEARVLGGSGSEVIHFSGDPKDPKPFQTGARESDLIGSLGNHKMQESYLKMEKQRNGGCD